MPTATTKNDSHHVVGYPSSLSTTILFLFIFLFCFFPSAFLPIIYAPFSILSSSNSPSSSKISSIPAAVPSLLPSSSQPQQSTMGSTSWFQKTLQLPAKARGSYLITDTIVNQLPELRQYKVGILHLFAMHTSCALSMNENWDSDVREDMSDAMDRIVPEDIKGGYRHSAEGSDDMPAHVKSALIGSSVTIPIKDGKLATGTWQGIWYLEFRAAKHQRTLMATIQGEKM